MMMMMMIMMTMMIMMCFVHPNGSQTLTAPGARPINYYDDNDDDDDDADDDDEVNSIVAKFCQVLPSLSMFSHVYPQLFKSSQV